MGWPTNGIQRRLPIYLLNKERRFRPFIDFNKKHTVYKLKMYSGCCANIMSKVQLHFCSRMVQFDLRKIRVFGKATNLSLIGKLKY